MRKTLKALLCLLMLSVKLRSSEMIWARVLIHLECFQKHGEERVDEKT